MFITNRQAEVSGSQVMLAPDQQGWHFVQKHLMSPWFHTTIVRCEDGLEIHDVVFVDSIQTLTSLLDLAEKGVYVKSVQLVSPGWLNGFGDWRMETLLEVAQSQNGTSLRYTLQGDRNYYFPESLLDTTTPYCVQLFPKPPIDRA